MPRFLHHMQREFVQFWQLERSEQAKLQVGGLARPPRVPDPPSWDPEGSGFSTTSIRVCDPDFLSDFPVWDSFLGNRVGSWGINFLRCFISWQFETFTPSHSQPLVAMQVWQVWTRGHHSFGDDPPSSPGHSSDLVMPGTGASRGGRSLRTWKRNGIIMS